MAGVEGLPSLYQLKGPLPVMHTLTSLPASHATVNSLVTAVERNKKEEPVPLGDHTGAYSREASRSQWLERFPKYWGWAWVGPHACSALTLLPYGADTLLESAP